MITKYFVNVTDIRIQVPQHIQAYAEAIWNKSIFRPGTVDTATAEKEFAAWLNAIGLAESESVAFLMDCGKIWVHKETEV